MVYTIDQWTRGLRELRVTWKARWTRRRTRGQGGGKFPRAKNEEKSPHELEIIFFSDLFVGGEIVNFES